MDRCALCPGQNACIPPDIGYQADILFVGEAPGKDENRNAVKNPPGVPFIGKTGEEVNRHYLPLAGLLRERVAITNAIACYPVSSGGKLDPKRAADLALLECCTRHHLYSLIDRLAPRLLVPLGAFAIRALCPTVDLELGHGIPVDTDWGIPAFPMYHPALGIYEPKKMLYIRNDWIRLNRYLKGKLHVPQDEYPDPDYREITDVQELRELDPTLPLGADTESDGTGQPFCLTYSQHPGTGRLINADRHDLIQELGRILGRWESRILFHFWLHDSPVTAAMGLRVPHRRVVDTSLPVFFLGNLPQGLKALAFRELGMVMQDFEDLVLPYSRNYVIKYFLDMQAITWPRPEERLELDPKTSAWKLKKPQTLNTRLKRFFTDLNKYGDDKDVFKTWGNWESEREIIEAQMGPFPHMDIRHVPFEKTLYYTCRDSDALIRLWPIIKGMLRVVRKFDQSQWREKCNALQGVL